jgi:hypothetical protein
MAIVFILLGALAATLFIVSKLGWDLPPQPTAEVETLTPAEDSLLSFKVAA